MQYSIKDLEKLSSIKAHTIRIWEKRYHELIQPERTDTNIRYYNESELKHLMNISVLVHSGFKISHIAKLSHSEINEKASFLLQNAFDQDNQIKNLILCMIELNEAKFEKIFSKSILSIGFEKTMLQIIYPFLQQIGVLWQTNSISPGQEHFITNLLRQKLISAIDALETQNNVNSKRFVLFLPEGEMHELGLLFYYYLLKTRGHHVLYLGQSTPLNSLVEICNYWVPEFVLFFAVSSITGNSCKNYLNEISTYLPDRKIIVAGQQFETIEKLPANISRFKKAQEFITFIDSL